MLSEIRGIEVALGGFKKIKDNLSKAITVCNKSIGDKRKKVDILSTEINEIEMTVTKASVILEKLEQFLLK